MDNSSATISAGTLSITSQELLHTVPTGLWETLPATAVTYMDQSDYWHKLARLEETVQRLVREVERMRELLKDGFSIDLGDLLVSGGFTLVDVICLVRRFPFTVYS